LALAKSRDQKHPQQVQRGGGSQAPGVVAHCGQGIISAEAFDIVKRQLAARMKARAMTAFHRFIIVLLL
jgi:hypothetical protein